MSRLSISVVGIGAFVLFVLFSFATAISISNVGNEAAANPKQQHCEPIKIPLCKGMRYTLTTMPNHFGQATQEIAIVDLAQYQALANVNCSSELQLFLCSMYTPICIKDYTNDIPVCRAVCERVKAG